MIAPERLKNIPPDRQEQHSFCFWLHDRILDVLRQASTARVATVQFKFENDEEARSFESAEDAISYFLKSGNTELAKRIVLNHTVLPLFGDALNFICESLFNLEKRKITVSLALLRKPLRESLLLLTWIFADEDEFFARMQTDAASLDSEMEPEQKKKLIARAIDKFEIQGPFDAEVIYGMVFDKKNKRGLGHYFDQALHLVTRNAAFRTENLNLNMIFKNPSDDDVYHGIYEIFAYLLTYLLFLEVEMVGHIAPIPDSYKAWVGMVSIFPYTALFTDEPDWLDGFGESIIGLLTCSLCGEQLSITREGALEFFALERITCKRCGAEQQFPLFWLMSTAKMKATNGETHGEESSTK